MKANENIGLMRAFSRSLENVKTQYRDLFPVEISLLDTSVAYAMGMEAEIKDAKNLGINQSGTPMKIGWCTDQTIEAHHLKPVRSAVMFERGNIPADNGLFSYDIFGNTADERKWTYAYIDLGRKFFHPYAFEVLTDVCTKARKVAAGMGAWRIKDGELELMQPDDKDYDPSATGMRWLVSHYHDIQLTKNQSYKHNEYVELLTGSSDDEIFITKFLVVPVFYRDANFSGKKREIPEINEKYKKLIQLVNALKAPSMAEFSNNTELSIQTVMVDIRKFGQEMIQGKRGFIKQAVIGKTTSYGARSVITQPVYADAQTPEDLMVDIFHTGFPIATCCSMAYPFIEHWILNFFAKEFETREKKQILYQKKDGSYELGYAKIGDVLAYYNPGYIEKKTEQFMHTYGKRFEPLVIPMADGSEAYMLFTGRPYSKNPRAKEAPPTARRAMTWTDLLYLACVETLEFGGKMAYVTRYPLEDYFGTFPSMIRVTSTAEHEPMEFNGRKYPFYPKVIIGITQDETSTKFIDTVTMDNVYLPGLGGDYDGDTVSEKTCFSEEANDEAYQIMNDPKHFISISGNLTRMIKQEAHLTFYAMTMRRK